MGLVFLKFGWSNSEKGFIYGGLASIAAAFVPALNFAPLTVAIGLLGYFAATSFEKFVDWALEKKDQKKEQKPQKNYNETYDPRSES